VIEEVAWIQKNMPQVREIFFDDDTFTDLLPRAQEIARGLGKLGVTWSCNAKANVPYDTLKIMRDNGLRLLLVGYETGSDQILRNIKKGMRTDVARRFTRDCRELGITIHGTFILGLPGETRETIEQTIAFAKEINPHTIQVSLAAPYPGTELYRDAIANGWLSSPDPSQLVDSSGTQLIPLKLSAPEGRRDLPRAGTLLQELLFSAPQDHRDGRRDVDQLGDDPAPVARGGRVHAIPESPRRLTRVFGKWLQPFPTRTSPPPTNPRPPFKPRINASRDRHGR